MNTSPDTNQTGKPPLSCLDERRRVDLKAYVDGELSPLRRRTLEAHLRRCEACREERDDMKTIMEKLRGAENAGEAAGLSTALRSRLIAAAPSGAQVDSTPLWQRQPLLVFGGGGAAVLASGLVFLSMQSGMSPSTISMATRMPPAASMPASAAAPMADEAAAPAGVRAASVAASRASVPASSADKADFNGPELKAKDAPLGEKIALVPKRAAGVIGSSGNWVQGGVGGGVRGNLASAPKPEPAPLDNATFDRQVHREASVGIQVNGLEATSDRIEEMVKAGGGYVASNNLSTDDDGYKSADLSLRVPTKDFDEILSALAKLGNVVSKSISGEDITEKVSDATSAEQVLVDDVHETEVKLRNQSMSERRTGQKEAELRDLRIQLAQTRSRLGLLRKMASLSTINVSLTEKPKKHAAAAPKPGFWTDMHETNRSAMAAFQSAVRVPLVLGIWVLAFSPIWVPLVLAYRYASLRTLAKASQKNV